MLLLFIVKKPSNASENSMLVENSRYKNLPKSHNILLGCNHYHYARDSQLFFPQPDLQGQGKSKGNPKTPFPRSPKLTRKSKASKKPPTTLSTITSSSRTGTVIENSVGNSDTDVETPSSLASVVTAFDNQVSLPFFTETSS